MVDNENQWDEIEYSDNDQEYYDSDNNNSEYSEEDYENGYEDTENDDVDYDNQSYSSKKKTNMLPLIIVLLLLLGIGGFFAITKLSNGGGDQNVAQNSENSLNFDQQNNNDQMFGDQNGGDDDFFANDNQNDQNMMDVNFNDTGDAQVATPGDNPDTIATVRNENDDLFNQENTGFENNPNQENNDIIISYDKAARLNPFKPPFADKKAMMPSSYSNSPDMEFEIIEPPTTSVPDISLTKLLQTQISGILYDDESPSAIVNLNGVDTFVKVGDTIYGYTIQAITRNKVQITYRNNTYVASVGELFTRGKIENKPAVANLEKKFAGRYNN